MGVIIVLVGVSSYFYADARINRRFIDKLTDLLKVERDEKREFASKALEKRGSRPLGYQPPEPKPQEPVQKVLTRAEAQKRNIVDKAKEIMEK